MPTLHTTDPGVPLGTMLCFPLGILAVLGTVALAACAAGPRAGAARPSRTAALVFTCDDATHFSARYDRAPAGGPGHAGAATLRFVDAAGDRVVRVTSDSAASGARYRGREAAGEVTFWEHQRTATLTMPAAPARTCRPQEAATPWDEARLLGAEYRAVGQEPGWALEVYAGRRLSFIGDYGNTRIVASAPPPATETAAPAGGGGGDHTSVNRVTYAAHSGAHTIAVEVVRQECRDEMSGERYPTTAVIRLDGREYRGCGRWLGPEPRG